MWAVSLVPSISIVLVAPQTLIVKKIDNIKKISDQA